jgi:hypothetical protein
MSHLSERVRSKSSSGGVRRAPSDDAVRTILLAPGLQNILGNHVVLRHRDIVDFGNQD